MRLNQLPLAKSLMKQMNIVICLLFLSSQLHSAQSPTAPVFELITLGDTGGIQDGNLSAFLLRSLSEPNYIALDAGTLVNGINVAQSKEAFKHLPVKIDNTLSSTGNILHHHIKGYLISHGHLDHVAGLLIASPDDNNKPIYGLKSVNQTLSDTYFNWQAWVNFTDRGTPPLLKKYQVIDLIPQQATNLKNTQLNVTAFSLSHTVESTAFVIEYQDNMVVYFGDTGPDEVEKQGKLSAIWQYLAKQMQTKRLRGLIIEASFENQQPDNQLFGHLTPKWLMSELTRFHALLDNKTSLTDMQIVISHIKYSLKNTIDPKVKIKQQLEQLNQLGLNFIMAKQGQRIVL